MEPSQPANERVYCVPLVGFAIAQAAAVVVALAHAGLNHTIWSVGVATIERMHVYYLVIAWCGFVMNIAMLSMAVVGAVFVWRDPVSGRLARVLTTASAVIWLAGIALSLYPRPLVDRFSAPAITLFIAGWALPTVGSLALLFGLSIGRKRPPYALFVTLGLAAIVSVLSLGYLIYRQTDGVLKLGPLLELPDLLAASVGHAVLAAVAFGLAFPPRAPITSESPSHAAFTGTAFRTIGTAMFVRIGVSWVLFALVTVCSFRQDYVGAQGALAASMLATVGTTLYFLTGLVQYAKIPFEFRDRTPISVAILLFGLGAVSDLWGSWHGLSLYSAVAQLTNDSLHASFPSFREVEFMQNAVTWGSAVSMVCGYLGSCALLVALRQTTLALGDQRLQAIATRMFGLLLFAGALGVATIVLVLQKSALFAALPIVALLGVGIALLVAWAQLLFGLAKIAESGASQS